MKNIIIFTVGYHARATYRYLARQRDVRVLGFVDNNPAVHGTSRFGLPVHSPRALAGLAFDLIALPGRNQRVIFEQLTGELGIDESRIWTVRKCEVPPAPEELARRNHALTDLLRYVVSVFEAAGIGYWAMHSGLLALMRGNDLALLSDLDFCVDVVGFEALVARFRSNPHGFEVTTTVAPDGTLAQISLNTPPPAAGEEPAYIDLHPVTIGDDASTWPSVGRTFRTSLPLFRSHETKDYRGIPVRVPVDPEAVLIQLYGDDWRTPLETWNGRTGLHDVAIVETLV